MKKIADKFQAVIGLIVAILILFAKWLRYQDISYTIFQFYGTVNKAGGIVEFSKQTEVFNKDAASIVPAYLFLALAIILAVVLLLRSLLLFAGKGTRYLTLFSYWLSFIYILTLPLCAYDARPALMISVVLMIADYMGARFIMEHDEINRKARELRRQEALALADKKRRMRFPGRYSKEFFQVIFANFKSNFRSYLLFIVASSSSISLIYMMTGANGIISTLTPNADISATMRILEIIKAVSPLIILLTVMLLVLIISNYIKTRMKNYSIFIGLGIRKKTLGMIIALEYVVCILVSCIIGLVLGIIFLLILKSFFLGSMGIHTDVSVPYAFISLITCGAYLLMTGFATLINYHLFEHVDISSAIVKSVKADKLPRHMLIPGLLIGLYYIINPISHFVTGRWGEETSMILNLLVGVLFVLYCGGTILLKRALKNRAFYCKNLFRILPWRYRFKMNAKYWVLLFALNVFALSVFLPRLSSCFIAEPVENLYPYDFVCFAGEQDEPFFEDLKDDYDVQMETYPMVRINTVLGVPYSWYQATHTTLDGMVFPQGQHTGISESTYQKLKAISSPDNNSPLNLEGKEIHVVRQQDASAQAHPLDWYQNIKTPRLRAGAMAAYDMETLNQVYPPHHIKDQEKASLIGMFQGGDQESLVVFSDSYFAQLMQSVQEEQSVSYSPTQLITLQAKNHAYKDLSDALNTYTTPNEEDPSANYGLITYYEKDSLVSATTGERFFKIIAYFVVSCILLICSLFIFYLKYSLETAELEQRNRLLESVGMSHNSLVSLMKREMRIHSRWTLIIGFVISACFFLTIPVIRLYNIKEALAYCFVLFVVIAAYGVLYLIGMGRLEKHFIKETCKR